MSEHIKNISEETPSKEEMITTQIENYKEKKNLAKKISSKANKNKEKWAKLSFPDNNDKFDYIVAPANVITGCAGAVAGGAVATSNGENQMAGMLIGLAVGTAVLPLACLAAGGIRRVTQLIADKCYKNYDRKQKQLTRQKNKLKQKDAQEFGN